MKSVVSTREPLRATPMVFGDVFERFLAEAPVSVMFRVLMQHALDRDELDRLFDRAADKQYTRQLLFSSVVDLLAQVVCRVRPSVHAAYQAAEGVDASVAAVYQKLQGIEPAVASALVAHTAGRLAPVWERLDARLPQPIAGYRARVLDGNHLAGTEHRPRPTRTRHAAPRPGVALVLLDLATATITDVVADPDAYASEHTLAASTLGRVEPGDLWVADRGLCSTRLMLGVQGRGGRFVVRQHGGNLRWEEAGQWGVETAVATGSVSEQPVRIHEVDSPHRVLELRRVRVRLASPTRQGEAEVFLLTDLPAGSADAATIAAAYQRRWTIETAFQGLTQALRCEVRTLAYPGAALLGFCLACVAWNLLAVVRGALRAEHGAEAVEEGVSNYHLAQEVAVTQRGMMIALPASSWEVFEGLTPEALAGFLREAACQVRLRKYPRARHGPKGPRPRRTGRYNDHVSTKRLLDQERKHKTAP